jgi:hypothetical protein
MTHFRVDFWSPNLSIFKVKLVDFGPNGQYAGGDDSESELSYSLPTDTWHTLEIPLSSFTSLAAMNHLSQLVFSGTPSGSGTVYIDNVLFFNNEGASILEVQTKSIKAFPNPSTDNILLSAEDSPMNTIQVFGLDGTLLMEDYPKLFSYSLDLSTVPAGIYLVRISQTNNTETLRIIKE